MDSRGFPTTLPEFQRVFPDDAASARYLEHLRWPHGFTCFKCGNVGEPYRFAKRRTVVLRCRACHSNISLTAGTVMRQSHTPVFTLCWGCLDQLRYRLTFAHWRVVIDATCSVSLAKNSHAWQAFSRISS